MRNPYQALLSLFSLFFILSCGSSPKNTNPKSASPLKIELAKQSTEPKKVGTIEPYPGLQIFHYKMDNGLNILLVPRKQNGNVAVTVGYNVGSRHEEIGKTGLAHLFEHMMFRGTESFPEPFRTLSEWGGQFNAFTSPDQTVYYELVPAGKLSDALRFEAERMRKLLITPEIFNTERGAVVSERKMNYEDSPGGRLLWETYQLAFDKHPYKTIPIGWQDDVERATFEDALSFYTRYYAPNRATLVLVGDFEESKALQLIEKFYGRFKAVETKDVVNPQEDIYRARREKTVRIKTQSVMMSDAVFGPRYNSPEASADFFFCVLMADGSMGYLRHALVETNILRSASGSCYPDVETSLSVIRLVGAPGVSASVIKKKYDEAWQNFLPWAQGERFENIKKLFETSQLESLRNPMDLAQTLVTNFTAAGDPTYTFKLVEEIKALQFKQIEERYKEWRKRGGTRVIIEPAQKNDPMKKEKS